MCITSKSGQMITELHFFKMVIVTSVLVTGATVCAAVPMNLTRIVNGQFTLRLTKMNFRGPHFEVLVQNETGGYDTFDPGEVRTFIGTVDEDPAAVAVGYLRSDGVLLSGVFGYRGTFTIFEGDTAIYARGWNSGTTFKMPTQPTVTPGHGGTTMYEWGIGYDVDNDGYVHKYGSNTAYAVERIEFMNVCLAANFMQNVLLKPMVERVIIRASQSHCPYHGIGGTALISPLSNEWQTNQSDAMDYCFKISLCTPNIGGGVAYMNGAFNVNGIYEGNLSYGIARHELGHNWGVNDYEAGSPEGQTINCGNAYAWWCGPGIQDILNHRDLNLIGSGYETNVGTFDTVNIPPYPSLDAIEIFPGTTSVVIDVMCNDHDVNGDVLTLYSFEDMSTKGAAVTQTGSGSNARLVYEVSLKSGTDSFFYTVEDSSGQRATGVVVLDHRPSFSVAPADAFHTVSDFEQGSSSSRNYTLTNNLGSSFNWVASHNATWYDLSSYGGTLSGNASFNVNVKLNAETKSLAPGYHEDTIIFTDTANNFTINRTVSLDVKQPLVVQLDAPEVIGYSSEYPGGGYAPGKAVDNTQLDWATNGDRHNGWIAFDFGKPVTIDAVLFQDRSDGSTLQFSLTFSDDAIFGDAEDTTIILNSGGMAGKLYNIASQTARYVRYDVVQYDGDINTGITEISFYRRVAESPRSITGISITAAASSEISSPQNATNGNGLSGWLHDNNPNGETMWVGTNPFGGSSNPNPGTELGAEWIKFEFDRIYNLTDMLVWNYNQANASAGYPALTDRGMAEVYVEYSVDGVNYTNLFGDGNTTTLKRATSIDGTPPTDQLDFGGVQVKYVVITAASSNPNYGGDLIGLSEARFGLGGGPLCLQVPYPTVQDYSSEYPGGSYAPSNSIDYSQSDWSSNGQGSEAWISFDFGSQVITDSVLFQDRTNGSTLEFSLTFSDDTIFGDTGDTTMTFYNTGGTNSNLYRFGPQTARYVRYDVVQSRSTDLNTGIAEIAFYKTLNLSSDPISSVTATASSEYDHAFATNTVNSTGLSGSLHSNAYTDMWLGDGTLAGVGTHEGGAEWIKFDLKEVYVLDECVIWNYNQNGFTARGMNEVLVKTSTDGVNYTNLFGGESTTHLHRATGCKGTPPTDVINFDGTLARYVLIIASAANPNFPEGDQNLIGLSNVHFTGTPTGCQTHYIADFDFDGDVDLSDLNTFAAEYLNAVTYTESAGHVVMEAEHFTTNTPGSGSMAGSDWVPFDENESSDGFMQALPDQSRSIDAQINQYSPQLRYRIDFETAGEYYIWVKAKAADIASDSIHYGLDGVCASSGASSALRVLRGGSFNWISQKGSGERPKIAVETAGVHNFDLWMREDGATLDRVLLTTDVNYDPTISGEPAESALTDLIADLNNDGTVDLLDFSILARYWLVGM
ncbi:F5/8 type C domain protein [Anaerohalosphaera lusitana]|uniref:F5/8 type C domain protein n=1 Tax=Anaerohalosphaera lusitana TaxID=1936003 RepID=A0A1U9NLT5_9BACT|nr:discoidin domain-containing protein [Anaerohalosphaera lusitana]AQT68767.1 F5/8 type C domain protein [Anaerohalosphaera lusitana]